MKIIACTFADHGKPILEIFNEAIMNSTALYEYTPRTMRIIQSWFEIKTQHDLPVIGAVNEMGQLLGFASYGTFRIWPAFKYTAEHSVYVEKSSRGQGIGRALLSALITHATKQQYHVLVGGIDAENKSSIQLHESLGFQYSGTIKEAGYKFGRWLDLAFYQLKLETPHNPTEA